MVTSLDNVKVVLVEETNSTQDYALKLVKEDPENAYFVIAEKQTAGRGRKNNIWYSPEGGFWGTLAVPLKELLSEKQLTITHYATALMVQKAISEEYNVYTTIKWPNDIYLTNKKMGGVMVEYITGNTSYLNVGIGININLEYNDYPKELKHSMVSIKDIL